LTSKTEIKNRYWILQQFNEAPNDEICLTGYLNINPKSNWVTFTQVENETGKRIAGHLNFPIHKVKEVFENYKEFNHKQFTIEGKPSFYVSNGIKRGCVLLHNLSLKT
tara:strand:- start:353 stop:676 length:324 start_codon:yes stop_codon:yes gene_type:complete